MSYPFEPLKAYGRWPRPQELCEDPVRRRMCWHTGHTLYHEPAWMWLWLKLATGAFHWHDWGGPGRGSAPRLQNTAVWDSCARVSASRSFWTCLLSCIFCLPVSLFILVSQSLSRSLSFHFPCLLGLFPVLHLHFIFRNSVWGSEVGVVGVL